jgi:hypothetical protein
MIRAVLIRLAAQAHGVAQVAGETDDELSRWLELVGLTEAVDVAEATIRDVVERERADAASSLLNTILAGEGIDAEQIRGVLGEEPDFTEPREW